MLSTRCYVLSDDTVLDKHHSRRIELVRWQNSGNAHGVNAGISLVTCVYVNPETDQFWLIDYRLFAPDADGKTKPDHVAEMLAAGKTFYCPLKSNRLVDDSGNQQPDQPVGCRCWSAEAVVQGKTPKVKGMPNDCKRTLFPVRVSTHRTDYFVTNEAELRDTAAAEQESSARWTIEPFHRERRQLTGVQACQCRLVRSQRNHIGLAVRA